jgi:nucleotide-binding universal stress UspA family protein
MQSVAAETTTGQEVLARVLVGIDGSHASLEAAVQAGRLVAPEGTVELAAAIYLIDANLQHWPQEQVAATLEREARPWLNEAAAVVGPRATTRLLNGPSKQALLDEAERYDATLVAVGTHEHSRLSEMLIGGVAGPLLHECTCSVLIARPTTTEALFPLNILVGVDGSPGSLAALAVGNYLGTRFDTSLRVVLARHGDVDIIRAELHAPQLEILDGSAVDALVNASVGSDLVIVGSRGLHGLARLGSVSERVAHHARSSVMVVRSQPTTSG